MLEVKNVAFHGAIHFHDYSSRTAYTLLYTPVLIGSLAIICMVSDPKRGHSGSGFNRHAACGIYTYYLTGENRLVSENPPQSTSVTDGQRCTFVRHGGLAARLLRGLFIPC